MSPGCGARRYLHAQIKAGANAVQLFDSWVGSLSVTDYDSGGNAECRDDQGVRFDLFRPRPGY